MTHEDARPPSPRAVERLASDVGGAVADLRTSLHAALDEAGRLEAVGRHDLAASVLEEQRDALAALHQQLEERLAGAAVEREAEHVLSAAAGEDQTPTTDDVAPVVTLPTASASTPDPTLWRLAASAAAAVVGVALLLVPEVGGGMLTVAGWSTVDDLGGAPEQAEVDDAAATSVTGDTGPAVLPAGPRADRTPDRVADDAGRTPADLAERTPDTPVAPVPTELPLVADVVGTVQEQVDDSAAPAEEPAGLPTAEDQPEERAARDDAAAPTDDAESDPEAGAGEQDADASTEADAAPERDGDPGTGGSTPDEAPSNGPGLGTEPGQADKPGPATGGGSEEPPSAPDLGGGAA